MISLLLLASIARGADDENDRVAYKSKTEIDSEDLEIEGVLQKPQSALILDRKKASFNPLIRIRTDWKDEIEHSVDEIK